MLWAKRVDNVAFKTLEGVVGLEQITACVGRPDSPGQPRDACLQLVQPPMQPGLQHAEDSRVWELVVYCECLYMWVGFTRDDTVQM